MDGLASLAAAAALFDESSSSQEQLAEQSATLTPSKRQKNSSASPSKRRKKAKEEPGEEALSTEPAHTYTSLNAHNDTNAIDNHGGEGSVSSSSEIHNQSPLVQALMTCLSPLVRLRCQYEWFYSTIDRDYFKQNEFLACLNQMGLHEASNLTKEEWAAVRSYMGGSIGRPRRFSASFIRGELTKLEGYRCQVRRNQYSEDPPPSEYDFPYQIYFPVRVGDRVTVAHPSSCSLQRGLVLSLHSASEEHTTFRVQCDRADLGHLLVEDSDVAIHGEAEVLFPYERLGERQVLEEQGGAVRPRVGVLTRREEGVFRSTWERCVQQASKVHHECADAASTDTSGGRKESVLQLVKDEVEDGDPKPEIPSQTDKVLETVIKQEQVQEGGRTTEMMEEQSELVGAMDRMSVVCLASLLFLRHMTKTSPSNNNNEQEAAVFSANTAAYLLQKINAECVGKQGVTGADIALQHKLSMLFVLSQTCTQSRSLGA